MASYSALGPCLRGFERFQGSLRQCENKFEYLSVRLLEWVFSGGLVAAIEPSRKEAKVELP